MSQAATSTEEIKTRKVEQVLQQLDALPTLPAIVVRLLALTNSHEGGGAKIQEVVQLLAADQSLTGKLLSLAGSAAAGVRVPVTSVQQAVVLLGFETVRNLALSVKVFEVFQQAPDPPPTSPAAAKGGQGNGNGAGGGGQEIVFRREEFWKHSLAVATAAEMLAVKVGGGRLNPADAFVCGLMHDIGKVAFDTVMPKSFARVVEMATLTRGDIADMERRVVGLDHALAGKRLAEAWNLPQIITQTIWLHGAPPPPLPTVASLRSTDALKSAANTGRGIGVPPMLTGTLGGGLGGGIVNLGMVLLVGLADMLVRRQHIGFSGNYLFPYDVEQYTHHLGLTPQDIDSVTIQLADALETRARAIGLYDVESRQLYLASIANANAELGRINQQLAVQNRKLSTRSNCFEMLTRFYQRIVPAASPAQLLAEIGAVAQPFLDAGGAQRLVLFSQDPDQSNASRATQADALAEGAGEPATGGVGEVLLFDPTQSAHDSFLMHMPLYGGDQRVGRANQNFMRPASPQLDWLLERTRNFLSGGTAGAGAGTPLSQCWFMPLLCGNEPVGGIIWVAKESGPNALAGVADMILVSQSWGMTLRTAHWREQQMILTEALAASNRDLGAMQQQRIREKSLASLGEMAAGAGHEMNNPLSIISGRAQLLAAKISDAGMKSEASLIAQQADRLSQIITDMMEFAKPISPRMSLLNLRTIVDDAVKAALDRAGIAENPPVKILAVDQLPAARGDARQIQNAIAEVVHNALQASRSQSDPARQLVTVSLRFDPLDQHIIIQIADRGTGMSQDIVKNAFAPFFSAKSAGRNRGMGLAKALRWIENHGGTIRLDTTLHTGTTAVLLLPLNPEPPPQ